VALALQLGFEDEAGSLRNTASPNPRCKRASGRVVLAWEDPGSSGAGAGGRGDSHFRGETEKITTTEDLVRTAAERRAWRTEREAGLPFADRSRCSWSPASCGRLLHLGPHPVEPQLVASRPWPGMRGSGHGGLWCAVARPSPVPGQGGGGEGDRGGAGCWSASSG
jgi:hypothetical protein